MSYNEGVEKVDVKIKVYLISFIYIVVGWGIVCLVVGWGKEEGYVYEKYEGVGIF